MAAIKDLRVGSPFAISLLDSYDLCKLTTSDLTREFAFDEDGADRVVASLTGGDVAELGNALGIRLNVDKSKADSLMKDASIIRSAGAWADEPRSLEETLKFFHQLRHHGAE
ncbi:MAG: hypothetical protein HYS13_19610 [Planctomycetia bacterium]|nr:hypothetical protein [Planctomycetia bacterium]